MGRRRTVRGIFVRGGTSLHRIPLISLDNPNLFPIFSLRALSPRFSAPNFLLRAAQRNGNVLSTVPVYVLNGRNPSPGLEGNEEAPPPMGASPHPEHLPFLNAMQQEQHNAQVWHLQNAANAWEVAPQPPPLQQGWGVWPELPPVPPVYQGFSYMQYTGYDGPSMMDGIQTDDSGFDDGLRVWNEHVAMIEDVAEGFIQGNATRDLAFRQVNSHEIILEVPSEENWLTFMIQLYCTVFTPRLGWISEENKSENLWKKFADGLQGTLTELVGMACFTAFPFSPFSPGTNIIHFSEETWSICCEFVSDRMHSLLPPSTQGPMDTEDWSLTEGICLLNTQPEQMEVDTFINRKKRRMNTPLEVSEVRRSVRATRYQGFKAPSMADNKKKPSYVKPRHTPDILEMQQLQSFEETLDTRQIPPPTLIETLQYLGTTTCAVPQEELTKEKLLATPRARKRDRPRPSEASS